MKKLFLGLVALISVTAAAEQVRALQVTLANGDTEQFVTADIDSLWFSADYTTMFVSYKSNVNSFASADVSKMTYAMIEKPQSPVITWNGNSVSITNPLSSAGVTITASGADVSIESTATDEIEYVLSGSSSDGSLHIVSDKKYQLTLNGLSLTNADGPAINSQTGKKGTIFLQAGTTNTLTDGKSYASSTEDQKATLFSEGQLIFKGSGTLNIYSNSKHGICSDDYLDIRSGVINVLSAAKDGLHANDSILISGGTISLIPSADGIDCDGSILISGGKIGIVSNGTGAKGIKSNGQVVISSGDITVSLTGSGAVVTEDGVKDTVITCGIKADSGIYLYGGNITLNSTGSKGTCGIKTDLELVIGTAEGGPVLSVTTTGDAIGTDSSGRGGWWKPASITGGGGPGGGGGGPGGGGGGGSSYYGDPKAIKAKGAITMNNGYVVLNTSGNGGEALESKTSITLNGGYLYAFSKMDDALNSSGAIINNGAYVMGVSQNNDAIDSNLGKSGAITIAGGVMLGITSAGSPEEGFDCDNNSYIKITGGCALSAGGSQGGGGGWGGSSSSLSSTQGYILYTSSWSMQSKKYYHVMDGSGNCLFSFLSPDNSVSSTLSLITATGMSSGQTYYVKYSGSAPANPTVSQGDRIFVGGTVSDASQAFSFTATQ